MLRGTPPPPRRHAVALAVALSAALAAAPVAVPIGDASFGLGRVPAATAEPFPAVFGGVDLTHPRILFRPGEAATIQDRVTRDPYRGIVRDMTLGRIDPAPPPSVADQADCVETANRNREGGKAKAAKDLAFLFAIDRRWDAGTDAVVTPSASERAAMGDRVRDHLLTMCTESRIREQTDRDINTSHELTQMAIAYDLLKGGGYAFGAGVEDAIVANIARLTRDFHRAYTDPDLSNFNEAASKFLLNNHLSKGAAAIGTAAIVLADRPELQGEIGPWLDFAFDKVDEVQRWTYGTADGGYGEGTHYWRFAAINVLPFLRGWDRLTAGRSYTTAAGLTVPSLWRHPQLAAMQRWMIDLTLPSSTLAPIDDGNVGERMWFGAFDPDFASGGDALDAGALSWAWRQSSPSFETDASVDMAADQIAAFDDTVAANAPAWSPTRFYAEGGSAVFRSAFGDPQARAVVVQAEHGAAREFGRDRAGLGQIGSAPHDHADPGSWLMEAYGERLMLDPGYVDYDTSLHWVMNKPSDHNMVLVTPAGQPGEAPRDPLTGSWDLSAQAEPWFTTPGAAPPVDGEAELTDTFDAPGVDGATVRSTYGGADVSRRFLFLDDDYVVIVDDAATADGSPRTFTWPLHGYGGGSAGSSPALAPLDSNVRPPQGAGALDPQPVDASGGTFAATATGGEWTRPSARVTVGMATDAGPLASTSHDEYFEDSRESMGSYTALSLSQTASHVGALTVAYPSPATTAAPTITPLAVTGGSGLHLVHPDHDRDASIGQRRTGAGGSLVVGDLETDGTVAVADLHGDGSPRLLHADGATYLRFRGTTVLQGSTPGVLSIRYLDGGGADVVADNADPTVTVVGLPTAVNGVDGSCGLVAGGTSPVVAVGTDRRFTLRPSAGGSGGTGGPGGPGGQVPAADAGAPVRAVDGVGPVTLDGSASCDPDSPNGTDETALSFRWEVASAPSGSTWGLTAADTARPVLDASLPGRYRVRLEVTDPDGNVSRQVEQVLLVGTGAVVPPVVPPPTPPVATPHFSG